MYRIEAYLKPETPFLKLFPEGSIPVQSIIPTALPAPTDQGQNTFYIVNPRPLKPEQLQGLAEMLLNNGQGVPSLEDAIAYIQNEGLPIRTSWFSGCETNDPGIFFSMMDGPEEFCENSQPDDFDEDDDDDFCY